MQLRSEETPEDEVRARKEADQELTERVRPRSASRLRPEPAPATGFWRARKYRGLRWTLGIVTGLLILANGFYQQTGIPGVGGSVEEELAKARSEGLATSPAELRAQINRRLAPLRTGKNAAEDFTAAFALVQGAKQTSKVSVSDLLTGSFTPAELAGLRSDIAYIDPALRRFLRGTEGTYLDYDRKWELGPNLLFGDLAPHKRLTNALVQRAILRADSDRAAAVADLRAAAKASRFLATDPTLISALVRVAEQSIVCDGLAAIVRKHPNDAGWRADGRAILDELGPVPDTKLPFSSELAMSRVASEIIANTGMSPFSSETNRPSYEQMFRIPLVRNANEIVAIRCYRELGRLAPSDPKRLHEAGEQSQILYRKYDAPLIVNLYAQLFVPVLNSFYDAIAEAEMRRRVLRHSFDALDTKARTGQFPREIEETDLFGKPVVYRKLIPNGFELYSFGRDGKDNGGGVANPNSSEHDIGYRF